MAQSLRVSTQEKDPLKVNSALNQVAEKIDGLFGGTPTLASNITISPASGIPLTINTATGSRSSGIVINNNAPTGSSSNTNVFLNQILAGSVANPDTIQAGTAPATAALYVQNVIGTGATGGRIAIYGLAEAIGNGAVGAGNLQEWVGVTGQGIVTQNMGGTNTGAGAAGAIWGGNFYAKLGGSATNIREIIGIEINTEALAGSSIRNKFGLAIVNAPTDAVNGTNKNSAFAIANPGATALWDILLDMGADGGTFPIKAAGTILKSIAGTTTDGVNIAATTFTGNAWASPSATLTGAGVWSAASYTSVAGAVNTVLQGNSGSGIGQVGTSSNSALQILVNNAQVGLFVAGLQLGSTVTGGDKGDGALNMKANLYNQGTQVVGPRITGYTAMTGTANKATAYDTSTVTLAQLAGRMMQLQADLTTHGLIGA